jgi:hypothetical protein
MRQVVNTNFVHPYFIEGAYTAVNNPKTFSTAIQTLDNLFLAIFRLNQLGEMYKYYPRAEIGYNSVGRWLRSS